MPFTLLGVCPRTGKVGYATARRTPPPDGGLPPQWQLEESWRWRVSPTRAS